MKALQLGPLQMQGLLNSMAPIPANDECDVQELLFGASTSFSVVPDRLPDTQVDLRKRPKTKVLVHFPCPDGAAVEYLLRELYPTDGKLEFVHYKHNDPIDVKSFAGHHVGIADYLPKTDVLKAIAEVALSVDVWDHHKSAYTQWQKEAFVSPKLNVWIDMSISASVMTWRMIHGMTEPLPDWLSSINEKDTGRFIHWNLSQEAFHLTLTADLQHKALAKAISRSKCDYSAMVREGLIKLKPIYDQIEAHLKTDPGILEPYPHPIASEKVLMCQLVVGPHPDWVSKYLTLLARRNQTVRLFVFQYYTDEKDHSHRLALRSNPFHEEVDQLDVSAIACLFGGGGHGPAAGITIPITPQRPRNMLVTMPRLQTVT